MITNARNSAEEQLRTSQELSLLRHSLADELAELSNEFVSVSSDDNDQPTLLEDVETLHRSLKELESVKSYVQVIQHGLKLRFVLQESTRHTFSYLFPVSLPYHKLNP